MLVLVTGTSHTCTQIVIFLFLTEECFLPRLWLAIQNTHLRKWRCYQSTHVLATHSHRTSRSKSACRFVAPSVHTLCKSDNDFLLSADIFIFIMPFLMCYSCSSNTVLGKISAMRSANIIHLIPHAHVIYHGACFYILHCVKKHESPLSMEKSFMFFVSLSICLH